LIVIEPAFGNGTVRTPFIASQRIHIVRWSLRVAIAVAFSARSNCASSRRFGSLDLMASISTGSTGCASSMSTNSMKRSREVRLVGPQLRSRARRLERRQADAVDVLVADPDVAAVVRTHRQDALAVARRAVLAAARATSDLLVVAADELGDLDLVEEVEKCGHVVQVSLVDHGSKVQLAQRWLPAPLMAAITAAALPE
jgi:hypothetical protein